MKPWCVALLICCIVLPLAAQDYYEEPSYECISPVMPGQQGQFTSHLLSLYAESSWSSDVLTDGLPDGGVFTVLEGPVCHEDHHAWIKIDYEGQQGWFVIMQYGMCDICPDDPAQFWARLYLPLETVAPTGDDPRLAPPVNLPSPNALMPENIASLVRLESWGEGHLQDIRWTDDGQLRVVTDTENRLYNPNDLTRPAASERAWNRYAQHPDGKIALVFPAWPEQTLTVRDIATDAVVATVKGENGVFDATGRYLAVSVRSEDADDIPRVDVYEINNGSDVRLIQTFPNMHNAMFFKDAWLIARTNEEYYALDIETGKAMELAYGTTAHTGSDGFRETSLSPDQTRFASIHATGGLEMGQGSYFTLFFYNLTELPPMPERGYSFDISIEDNQGKTVPYAMVWSPDSQTFVVSAGSQQTAYQINPFSKLWSLNLPEIINIAYSPDGSLIAFASADHQVYIYRGTEQLAVLTDSILMNRVMDFAFSPDSRTLAVADVDSDITLWDMQTFQMVNSGVLHVFDAFRLNANETEVQTVRRRYDIATQSLNDIVPVGSPLAMRDFLPDTWSQAAVSQDRTLTVVYETDDTRTPRYVIKNYQTGEILRTFEGYFHYYDLVGGSPRLSPDNRLLVVSVDSTDGYPSVFLLLFFEVETGDLLVVVETGPDIIGDIVFSADGKTIFWTTSADSEYRGNLYDIRTGQRKTFDLGSYVDSDSGYIALNYDGTLAFTATQQGDLFVWNTTTGAQITVPALTEKIHIEQMIMSKDGSRLFTVDKYGRFSIWGLPTE